MDNAAFNQITENLLGIFWPFFFVASWPYILMYGATGAKYKLSRFLGWTVHGAVALGIVISIIRIVCLRLGTEGGPVLGIAVNSVSLALALIAFLLLVVLLFLPSQSEAGDAMLVTQGEAEGSTP